MSDPATMAHHLTNGRFQLPPHVSLLSRKIVETVRSGGRLLVQMPPRHGKSETCSVWTPLWLLNVWPKKRVILASYEADFASSWGRRARNLLEEHKEAILVSLAGDSSAAYRWDTPEGGGMVTVGAGGALTGRGADLLIVDDPHKNAEEAHSEAHRERVWEWWTSTALTRLEPGAAAILIQTRWHEDDLAGRILTNDAAQWQVIRLPAIAEEKDAIGRPIGAALWPERFDLAALAQTRRSVGERVWNALYQQAPVSDQGLFFKREWLAHRYALVGDRVYRLIESGKTVRHEDLRRFATVDLATSVRTTADYSVILSFGLMRDGTMLVLNVDRARREGPDLIPAIKRAVDRFHLQLVFIEKTGFQLSIIQSARREGISVRELEADKDKIARALPATAALEGGRILLPKEAPWLFDFENELLAFPHGAFDDQADALSYAVRVQQDRAYYGGPLVIGVPDERPSQRDWSDHPLWNSPLDGYMPNPPEGWEHLDPRPWKRGGR